MKQSINDSGPEKERDAFLADLPIDLQLACYVLDRRMEKNMGIPRTREEWSAFLANLPTPLQVIPTSEEGENVTAYEWRIEAESGNEATFEDAVEAALDVLERRLLPSEEEQSSLPGFNLDGEVAWLRSKAVALFLKAKPPLESEGVDNWDKRVQILDTLSELRQIATQLQTWRGRYGELPKIERGLEVVEAYRQKLRSLL